MSKAIAVPRTSDGAPPSSTHFAISIIYYGRGDPEIGDGPAHVGIAVHADTEKPPVCHLHHIRCPTETRYIYDPRPEQPLASDPVIWGRCKIATGMPSHEATQANMLLADFGADERHLPEWNEGNCQDWMVAAVGMLEREGVVGEGEHAFWEGLIGRGAEEARLKCDSSRKVWVQGEKSKVEVIDAKWGAEPKGDIGKLEDNSVLRERMRALQGLMAARSVTIGPEGLDGLE